MVTKAILWDFDGTLAYRGSSWSDCLLELLDIHHPGHGHPVEEIRPYLRTGFPWHDHGMPHESPGDPGEWWRQITELIHAALVGLGYSGSEATDLAADFRLHYLTLDEWRPAEDAIPALTQLRERGWAHFVLSNHVPELEEVVRHIGLGDLVEATLSSGMIGYEKPHAEAFRIALGVAGNPGSCWMVGDNPIADAAGAERAGIPAIWVRARDLSTEYVTHVTEVWARSPGWDTWPNEVKRTAVDLHEAAEIIERGQ